MKVQIRTNIKQELKKIDKFKKSLKKDVIASSVNNLAFRAQRVEKLAAKRYLDRPTKQTVNSIVVKEKAKPGKETAILGFRPWAEKYMKWSILGGTRPVTDTGVPTWNKKLNMFGNIAGRKSGLVKGKNQFISTINGTTGVWESRGRANNKKLRLLVKFVDNPQYDSIFPWFKVADNVVKNFLKRDVQRAWDYTARKAGLK
jgi:hypothetical protein